MLMQLIKCLLMAIIIALSSGCASFQNWTSLTGPVDDEINISTSIKSVRQQEIPSSAKRAYARAVWSAKIKKNDEAIQLFNNITKNYPDFARAYTNLGLLHLQQNDLIAAEQALIHAVKLYPSDTVSLNHLGVVLRKLGKFRQAKFAYLSAIKHDAKYAAAYYNMGILNDIYLQDLPQALSNYQSYLSLLNKEDAKVKKWIVDLKRRIEKINKKSNKKI